MLSPFILLLLTAPPTPPAASSAATLETVARRFLDAYARGDVKTALGLTTDRDDFRVFGSDASEFVSGREAFARMLEADQRLWMGKAVIGQMTHVSMVRSGDLASLFFDADFTLSGHTLPVRFATVWRWEGGGWRLVLSSNVVPTQGQSADAILRTNAKP